MPQPPEQDSARPELIALGQAVRRHRDAKAWTLTTLAAESGVSRRTIINVESGAHSTGIGSLFDIADALGVTLADLIRQAEVDTDG